MDDLVSVLIAVHNGERTVERAVRSALDQSHANVEVIVVDDGSTDESWNIICRIAEDDRRVVPVRRPEASGGPALPRNVALARATGTYFALLDQDDEWLPDKLAKQLPLFSLDGTGIVYADALTTETESYLETLRHLGSPPHGDVLLDILRWNFVPTCTAVWRREVDLELGGFVEELSTVDDRDYWIRAARAGFHFGFVPEPVAVYATEGSRLSDDSARHARLVVRMWSLHLERWPDDPIVSGTLRTARRFASHILARQSKEHQGRQRLSMLWEAMAMCPEPRNIIKILLTSSLRRSKNAS